MCPGIRPATGWIAYLTSTPRSSSSVRELAHVVLCLRDGHSVSGDDDHLAREGELHCDVLGGRRAHRPSVVGACLARACLHLAERAEEDVRDGTVHRLRHEQRQQRARGADEHPGHDQDGRVEHEPGRGRREPRERVQQRDDDRHVGAADREDEHDPEEQREADQRDQDPLVLGARDRGDSQGDRRRARRVR